MFHGSWITFTFLCLVALENVLDCLSTGKHRVPVAQKGCGAGGSHPPHEGSKYRDSKWLVTGQRMSWDEIWGLLAVLQHSSRHNNRIICGVVIFMLQKLLFTWLSVLSETPHPNSMPSAYFSRIYAFSLQEWHKSCGEYKFPSTCLSWLSPLLKASPQTGEQQIVCGLSVKC